MPGVAEIIKELPPAPWMEHAECRGANTERWFPGRGEDPKPAKRVCAVCPVRQECLDYALDNILKHGVWGGHTEKERKQIRRRRRIEDRAA